MSLADRPRLIPGTDIAIEPPEMTLDDFLALPDDGIHRELIGGRVRELGMTVRNRFHSRIEAKIVFLLRLWLEQQPEPWGQVLSGEVGFRLKGTKESLVGADVAYVSAALLAATGPKQKMFDGPPVLAVEIASGSETLDDLHAKVAAYLEAGAVVWEVDPDFRRISVHRAGRPPESFNETQELSGEPELPGFVVPVARLFTP